MNSHQLKGKKSITVSGNIHAISDGKSIKLLQTSLGSITSREILSIDISMGDFRNISRDLLKKEAVKSPDNSKKNQENGKKEETK